MTTPDPKEAKEKLLKSAKELKGKALTSAIDARKKIKDYAARGRKQRIIVVLSMGAIAMVVLWLFFNRALDKEEFVPHWVCKPSPEQDCSKYQEILNLWRPYRVTPYNVPSE